MGAAFGAGSQVEQNTQNRLQTGAGQNGANTDPAGNYSSTTFGFTEMGGAYAPIAGRHGVQQGNPWAVGTDVGSDAYLYDIHQQRMYETGGQSSTVDPTRFWYGGEQDVGHEWSGNMFQNAVNSANRQVAPTQQYSTDPNLAIPNMGAYDMGLAAQGNARNSQEFMLGVQGQDLANIRGYAQGTMPTAAEMAMQRQSDATMQQNLAMAATGRGAGANAMRMGALNQNAMQQGQLVRDLGIQAAQEQQGWNQLLQSGTGQMTDAYGNMRSSDLGMADMSGRMALDASQQTFDARLAANDQNINQAQYGTDAWLQQQQANDAMVQFYISQGFSLEDAILQSQIQMEAMRTNNILTLRGQDAGQPNDPSLATQILGAGIEAGGYVAGAYFGGPAGSAAGGAAGGAVNREMNS